jgi:hypothetical protein
LASLVVRYSEGFGNGLLIIRGYLTRPKFVGEIVDRAGEAETHVVGKVNWGSEIHSYVKRLRLVMMMGMVCATVLRATSLPSTVVEPVVMCPSQPAVNPIFLWISF